MFLVATQKHFKTLKIFSPSSAMKKRGIQVPQTRYYHEEKVREIKNTSRIYPNIISEVLIKPRESASHTHRYTHNPAHHLIKTKPAVIFANKSTCLRFGLFAWLSHWVRSGPFRVPLLTCHRMPPARYLLGSIMMWKTIPLSN